MRGTGCAGSPGATRGVTPEAVSEILAEAETVGYDGRGNRKALVKIGDVRLTMVIVEASDVVVTIWVE